ncbi:MAG: hypothetical protein ACYTGG_06205 [Planctomycetota bacterium]|jgi:hypothetical protein
MIGRIRTLDRRLLTRRCVACGYDGALLRGGQAPQCARCGCDLRRRPARSYAEMEGLLGQPVTIDAPLRGGRREERIINRWLAFLFIVAVGMMTLAFLVSAAYPF